MFQKLDLFLSLGEGETPTLLGPLERANLIHDKPRQYNYNNKNIWDQNLLKRENRKIKIVIKHERTWN
jgi:hypothetical protein